MARELGFPGLAGLLAAVPPCFMMCRCEPLRSSGYGHMADGIGAEPAVHRTAGFPGQGPSASPVAAGACRKAPTSARADWGCGIRLPQALIPRISHGRRETFAPKAASGPAAGPGIHPGHSAWNLGVGGVTWENGRGPGYPSSSRPSAQAAIKNAAGYCPDGVPMQADGGSRRRGDRPRIPTLLYVLQRRSRSTAEGRPVCALTCRNAACRLGQLLVRSDSGARARLDGQRNRLERPMKPT
jgi:hypothetical protein